MSANSRDILASRLAQFLRRNGDKVLNGSCKLALTTSALCLLNSLFVDVLSNDWYNTDRKEFNAEDIFDDVRFLYDFMKKTTNLKLFHEMQTLRGGVDLSHFSNLRVLELRKIPAHLIVGLNCLSVQLKALICTRSIYLLKEIFGSVSDDQNIKTVWTELKELNVSYNYLECLDSSLASLPNLEILDLSHNYIKSTDQIEVLENLSFVNLSYNQLESLPIFHSLSCRSIVKLYVRNNNLEDLGGLECLFNLEQFDAGYNLLSEYYVLNPLDKLKSLKMLNLEGNPLYFHNRHSMLVLNYLHPNVQRRGLFLNGNFAMMPKELLTNVADIGTPSTLPRHQTSLNTVVGDVPNMTHLPEINRKTMKKISELSDKSDFDDNSVSSCTSPEVSNVEISESLKKRRQKSRNSKKGKKFREALITDANHEDISANISSPKYDYSELPSHVKTKQVLEARRLERGKSWLIPDNPFQKSILLPPKVPTNTPIFSETVTTSVEKDNLQGELLHHLESQMIQDGPKIEIDSPLPFQEMTEVLEISNLEAFDRMRHGSRESDDIEILTPNNKEDISPNFRNVSSQDDIYDSGVYQKSFNSDSDHQSETFESGSEEEHEDSIFFVDRQSGLKTEAIFINIGSKYAKEKDYITGKLLDTLDLTSLLSVQAIFEEENAKYEILLEFDTVKTSRQKRRYIFDSRESTQKLANVLQPFADANTLKEVIIGALECLNCNSQFSKQVAHLKVLKTRKPFMGKETMSSSFDSSKGYVQEAYACPNCDSHILVEMDNIPLPAVTKLTKNPLEKSTEFATDNISPGSASSSSLLAGLFSSMKISPMLKRKVMPAAENSMNASHDANGSAGCQSLESSSFKRDRAEASISRNSSDITLQSNPSQSSFSVIPDPAMENNLNTIVERDSLLSLSPPVSRTSTICNPDNRMPESSSNESDLGSSNMQHRSGPNSSNTDDKDFHSLIENLPTEKTMPLKSHEVTSSDSEVFLSPSKSLQSSQPKNEASEVLELDETVQLLHILGEKKTVTYDMFRELDHRLKLYLEISILGEDEEFEACLQTSIVPLSTGEEFNGLFMFSSKKAYIIKFLPNYKIHLEQNESQEKWVQIIYSTPLSNLKQIRVLLGNQGLVLVFEPGSRVFSLIIRDSDVCNSFCALLSDSLLKFFPETDTAHFHASLEEALALLKESVLSSVTETNDPEVLLHFFAFRCENENDITLPFCIIVTHENIFASKILYTKQDTLTDLNKLSVYHYTNVECQQISDLISLKVHKDLQTLEVSFLDESSSTDEGVCWTLKMQTKSSLFSFISVIRGPWEEIFGVSLPLILIDI